MVVYLEWDMVEDFVSKVFMANGVPEEVLLQSFK